MSHPVPLEVLAEELVSAWLNAQRKAEMSKGTECPFPAEQHRFLRDAHPPEWQPFVEHLTTCRHCRRLAMNIRRRKGAILAWHHRYLYAASQSRNAGFEFARREIGRWLDPAIDDMSWPADPLSGHLRSEDGELNVSYAIFGPPALDQFGRLSIDLECSTKDNAYLAVSLFDGLHELRLGLVNATSGATSLVFDLGYTGLTASPVPAGNLNLGLVKADHRSKWERPLLCSRLQVLEVIGARSVEWFDHVSALDLVYGEALDHEVGRIASAGKSQEMGLIENALTHMRRYVEACEQGNGVRPSGDLVERFESWLDVTTGPDLYDSSIEHDITQARYTKRGNPL